MEAQSFWTSCNRQLGRRLRLEGLPEKPIDPWPDEPTKVHAEWWEARRARQKEIDESIARNADVEYLYDRPTRRAASCGLRDRSRSRACRRIACCRWARTRFWRNCWGRAVTKICLPPCPFPAREAGAIWSANRGGGAGQRGRARCITDFAQVVYENLKAAGVQNTKKGETLKFEWLRPFASRIGLDPVRGPLSGKRREQTRRHLHRPGIRHGRI